MNSFTFKSFGLMALLCFSGISNLCSQSTTPCASSYLLISNDPSSCSASPAGSCTGSGTATVFKGKIRVYFTTAVNIGMETPVITAAMNGTTDLLSNYRFCVSGDQGSAVARSYADYCIYGDATAGNFPTGSLQFSFTSSGALQSSLCSVINNLPCPVSYTCLSDQSGCSPCDTNYTILAGKVRIFFPSPIAAGLPNPAVTSIANGAVTLNQYKLCASASSATNVERSFVDYCVYTNIAGSVFPSTSALTISLQLSTLSVTQCVVSAASLPCPNAFASILSTSDCTPCDSAFPVVAGKIRLFFPGGIQPGLSNPVVTAITNAGVTLNQFRLCAVASANTNIERSYVDYCVYTNLIGSVFPNVPLGFTLQLSDCAIPTVCVVSPTPALPCIEGSSFTNATTGPGGAGGVAAGCSNQLSCSGQIVYFASKLAVNFSPCLPAGFPAPVINSFTRTDADGRVIRYCVQETSTSSALISQERCTVEYCVYSSLSGDTYLAGNPPLPLSGTYNIIINGVPGTVSQGECEETGNIILPVKLISFTANRKENIVALKWVTSTEISNLGFYIERNTGDGWKKTGFVPTKAERGNSNAELTYNFPDENPFTQVTFYRLKQVDNDGKFTYSDVRSVAGINHTGRLLISPNPSRGAVNLIMNASGNTYDVLITDMMGRNIRQLKNQTGNKIVLQNLLPGVYNIRVVESDSGKQYNEKLVVRN